MWQKWDCWAQVKSQHCRFTIPEFACGSSNCETGMPRFYVKLIRFLMKEEHFLSRFSNPNRLTKGQLWHVWISSMQIPNIPESGRRGRCGVLQGLAPTQETQTDEILTSPYLFMLIPPYPKFCFPK